MVTLVSFDWLLLTPIIWPRLSNFRHGRFLKNWSQKGKIHHLSVTIHLSLFIRYCSLDTIHDTVHSEFCLFKEDCPSSLSQIFLVVLHKELPLRNYSPFSEPFFERIPYFLLPYNLVTRISSKLCNY